MIRIDGLVIFNKRGYPKGSDPKLFKIIQVINDAFDVASMPAVGL